jgi:predicted TIM-barrel fold metal-dependent hydrolase
VIVEDAGACMKTNSAGLARLLVLAFCAIVQTAAAGDYLGPVIDTHAHLRLGKADGLTAEHPVGVDALRTLDDDAGIVQSALIVIARKGVPEQTRAQNDAVLAAAAASGGRFYPVVSVHPADAQAALAELERLANRGAREVKLHPNTQNFDVADPSVAAVVEKCSELGLVVLFDSYKPWDASEMGKFLLLAVQHPKARIVLAHMGFTHFREAVAFATLRRLGMASNVWFDISAVATTYADSPVQAEFVWTVRKVGVERILFGSDWPVDTPGEAVAAVRRLGLSEDEQRQVFHDNAIRLLGLEGEPQRPPPH